MSKNTHIDFIHNSCVYFNSQDSHGCYSLEEIREKVDRSDTTRFNTTPPNIQNSDTSTTFDPDEITDFPGSGNDSRGSIDFQSYQSGNNTGSSQENPLQARPGNNLPDSGSSMSGIITDAINN